MLEKPLNSAKMGIQNFGFWQYDLNDFIHFTIHASVLMKAPLYGPINVRTGNPILFSNQNLIWASLRNQSETYS